MKKPITIDLSVILDPYKLITVINGIDRQYSNIVIPTALKFIEIYTDVFNPVRFEVDEDVGFFFENLSRIIGLDNRILPNNFIVGLSLFKMAYDKGLIEVMPRQREIEYEEIGKKELGAPPLVYDAVEISRIKTEIYPDYPISNILFGAQYDGILPIYGNTEFLDYLQSDNRSVITPINKFKNKKLIKKLERPEIFSIEELFNYALNKNYFSRLDFDLSKSIQNYDIKKQVCLTSLEFVSTTAMDSIVFGGLPISSSASFIYNLYKIVVSKNK